MSYSDPNSRTLFVRNIPKSVNNEEFESHFSNYGPIKRCFIILDKENKKSRGFGYICYVTRTDAESALKEEHNLNGNKLTITFSDTRTKPIKNDDDDDDVDAKDENKEKKVNNKKIKKVKPDLKDKKKGEAGLAACTVVISSFLKDATRIQIVRSIKKLKKLPKYDELKYPGDEARPGVLFIRFDSKYIANNAILILKKWKDPQLIESDNFNIIRRSQEIILFKQHKQNRLIIRNLSYKCDKALLHETFAKFGRISETVIPTVKKGGKRIGCAFVQFLVQTDARKAVSALNGTSILGRVIAIDWAVSKSKFTETQQAAEPEEEEEVKLEVKEEEAEQQEDDDDDDSSSDDEDEEDEDGDGGMMFEKLDCEKADEESNDDDEDDSDESDVEMVDVKDSSEDASSEEDEENEDSEDDEEDKDNDDDDDETKDNQKTYPKKESDVGEGKTLFIRNLPFDATADEIGAVFSTYGGVAYCKVVQDKKTNHSKGTAFVKFKEKVECEEAFRVANFQQAGYGAGISIQGRKLLVSVAISHAEVKDIAAHSDDKKVKDLRNLGLVREGLIRPGTLAAEGLSQQDLDRRQKLEAGKRQKLKDLNTFVSTTRLSIHNIPHRVEDAELKVTLLKLLADESEAGAGVVINECRIMRDMNTLNADGKGKSRGFAFVNFEEHKHALIALRLSNNNPDIYGEKKRLIVEFSLENKAALQLKERRMQRSKLKQDQKQHVQEGQTWKRPSKGEMANISLYKGQKQSISQPTPIYKKVNKDGKQISIKQQSKMQKRVNTGLSSHWGEKVRHTPRENSAPKVNPKKRKFDSVEKVKKTPIRKPTKKQKTDDFDRIVNSYSKKFSEVASNKWYD